MVYIGVIAVSVLFYFESCYALHCMECLDVPLPSVCGQVATCQPNSSCLVREYITSSGGVLYASGCISDQKCSYVHQRALSSETQETDFDLDTCVHCCNDHDYCNIEGCGTKVTELSQRGPYCFECSVENDVYGCRNTRACDAGYACYISEASFPGMYKTGCMPKAVCDQKDPLHFTGGAPMLLGKRDNPLYIPLPHCCDTDFCNDILLFETNNTMIVDGSWSLWGHWSTCSLSCGYGGYQTRSRSCDNPPSQNGGVDCPGNETETLFCMLTLCPVDGGWSDWGNWSACSQTCGSGGNMTRGRTCDNPTPTHSGLFCQGPHIDVQACGFISCPVNGAWSSWQQWESCSVTCGSGQQTRARVCDNPQPQFNGLDCAGNATEVQTCTLYSCPVNGSWSDWGMWSACDKTCGADVNRTRERHCNNPPPQFGGATCAGHDAQTSSCNLTMCPDELCHSYGFSIVTVPETGKDLCLRLFRTSLTWHQAETQCESHSAHLVTVSSQPVDNAIKTFLHGLIGKTEYVWVGLSGTGEHRHDYNWLTGEPLEYSGHLDLKAAKDQFHGHPLLCGVLLWNVHESQWWAEPCNNRGYMYHYMCEINV